MNKISAYLLFMSALLIPRTHLFAELGCMEKSLNLDQMYDPKEYHLVEIVIDENGDKPSHCEPCPCPCAKYRAQARPLRYGQCPVCKHYRTTPSLIIVTEKVRQAAAQKITSPLSPVALEGQRQLIKQWSHR